LQKNEKRREVWEKDLGRAGFVVSRKREEALCDPFSEKVKKITVVVMFFGKK
jgi:hypothetical protein